MLNKAFVADLITQSAEYMDTPRHSSPPSRRRSSPPRCRAPFPPDLPLPTVRELSAPWSPPSPVIHCEAPSSPPILKRDSSPLSDIGDIPQYSPSLSFRGRASESPAIGLEGLPPHEEDSETIFRPPPYRFTDEDREDTSVSYAQAIIIIAAFKNLYGQPSTEAGKPSIPRGNSNEYRRFEQDLMYTADVSAFVIYLFKMKFNDKIFDNIGWQRGHTEEFMLFALGFKRPQRLANSLNGTQPARPIDSPHGTPCPTNSPHGTPTPGPEEGEDIAAICRHTGPIVRSSRDGRHGRDYILARQELKQRQRGYLDEYYATIRGGRPMNVEEFCIWEDTPASA